MIELADFFAGSVLNRYPRIHREIKNYQKWVNSVLWRILKIGVVNDAMEILKTEREGFEMKKKDLESKIIEQSNELQDLKYELCKAEEEKETYIQKLKAEFGQESVNLQQLEIQCNNYAQMIEKLNIEIDTLKTEMVVKNDEISSVKNQYLQLGTEYQTRLAEIEQNNQLFAEGNIAQFQSEITRLTQVLSAFIFTQFSYLESR